MMKTEDNLELIIHKLKDKKPKMKEPSFLTEQIMQEIRQRSEKKPQKLVYWFRYISTVAAALLFFLFVSEQSKEEKSIHQSETLPLIYISELSLTECAGENPIGSDYKDLYSCYLNKKHIQKDIKRKILNLSDHESNP